MWEMLNEEESHDYNPYDNKRKPHFVHLVDPETGTMVLLKSGSIIQVVKSVE